MSGVMKAIILNGSPRKNFNTARLLESAMKGASDAGAECEFVNLFGYEFTGCRSCFACKIKNSKNSSYQFSDYSRYDVMEGTQEHRAKYRDEQLPKDLEAAHEYRWYILQH